MTSTPFAKLRQQYQDIEDSRKKGYKYAIIQPKTIKEQCYQNHHLAEVCKSINNLSQNILSTHENDILPLSDSPYESFNQAFEDLFKFHLAVQDEKSNEENEETVVEKNGITMNDLVYDIKGAPHLSLFYDNDRYQEWKRIRKQNGLQGKKKKKKHSVQIDESDPSLTKFSGEECFGKYLDLNSIHIDYMQILKESHISYLNFLENLKDLSIIKELPETPPSAKFLGSLIEYLGSFIERLDPFCSIADIINQDLSGFHPPNIKIAGEKLPFFCPYCQKGFETKDLYENHMNLKSHMRNQAKAEKKGGVENMTNEKIENHIDFLRQKHLILCFLKRLSSQLHETIENAKRRQTLSSSIIMLEHDLDAPIVFDEDSSEDEDKFSNPKGLPLGWDGKPIPYWLYKLHGLSVEYKCEICGNVSYWGAVSFEKHFFEKKHIAALQTLGIPATKHFIYVTKVSEAISLFDRIKKGLIRDVWQKGEEEVETEKGSIYTRKVYEDLNRQMIINEKIVI